MGFDPYVCYGLVLTADIEQIATASLGSIRRTCSGRCSLEVRKVDACVCVCNVCVCVCVCVCACVCRSTEACFESHCIPATLEGSGVILLRMMFFVPSYG